MKAFMGGPVEDGRGAGFEGPFCGSDVEEEGCWGVHDEVEGGDGAFFGGAVEEFGVVFLKGEDGETEAVFEDGFGHETVGG